MVVVIMVTRKTLGKIKLFISGFTFAFFFISFHFLISNEHYSFLISTSIYLISGVIVILVNHKQVVLKRMGAR